MSAKLDLHSLVVFYYVASEGNITAAAGKEISEGRLKELVLSDLIWVAASALLRVDVPEHPIAEQFITLVKEAF